MILEKLSELKKNNRSIEEIYKYTTDIIFEEEDEEEEDIHAISSVKAYTDNARVSQNTNRSKSITSGANNINNSQMKI